MTAAMEAPAVSPVVTPPAPVAATPAISGDATFSSAQRRWIDETKRALLEGRAVGSTGVAVSDGHETLVVKDTSDSRFVRHPGFVSHEEAIVVAQTARERMVSSVDEFAQESLGLDLGRVPEHEVVRQAFQELGVGEPTQVYAMPTPDQTLSL